MITSGHTCPACKSRAEDWGDEMVGMFDRIGQSFTSKHRLQKTAYKFQVRCVDPCSGGGSVLLLRLDIDGQHVFPVDIKWFSTGSGRRITWL